MVKNQFYESFSFTPKISYIFSSKDPEMKKETEFLVRQSIEKSH